MNKIERLIGIVMSLLGTEIISANEFAKIFNVTKRTIQRDMDSLTLANIPIYAQTGPSGGYGIMEEYKLDKRLLTKHDLENILIALSGFDQLVVGGEVNATILKIQGMVKSKISPPIHLSFYEWAGRDSINALITPIQKAIKNHNIVSFDYIDQGGNRTKRRVEPYQLHCVELRWYLNAYCLQRQSFRVFKLARILSLQTEHVAFMPRKYPSNIHTVASTNEKAIAVKLRLGKTVRDQFAERYGESVLEANGQDYYLATINLPQNRFVFQFLAGFGRELKILEPEDYVMEFYHYLKSALDLYEK